MIKYCFIKNEDTGLVQLGVGCPDEYYEEIGMVQRDVEQSEKDYRWYLTDKCPHFTDAEKLVNTKIAKIELNDRLRDEALLSGVVYQNVLFDSDTDQKINLSYTISTMSDEDTIVWYGMNNDELLCTKEDLNNIGYLIVQLHTYCWTRNAEIKRAIEQAETLEELEAIDISYDEMDNE